MKTTTNYGLKKPESTDFYNVGDFNTNMDLIDSELKKHSKQLAQLEQSGDNTIPGDIQAELNNIKQSIIDVDAINESSGSAILLTDTAEGTLADFKGYGRSTQNGTPTPDSPVNIVSVAESGTLKIKSEGKNLIPYPRRESTHTDNGIEWTDLGDGRVKANGTATADSVFLLSSFIAPKGSYTCNGAINVVDTAIQLSTNGDYSMGANWIKPNITLTYNTDVNFNYCRILIKAGVTVNNEIFEPMLRRAEVTDNTYEPYKSSSISIPLTEPLRSVGDVKDEIACIDGVYGVIRRISTKLIDGVNKLCTYVGEVANTDLTQLNLGSTANWSDSADISSGLLFMCDKIAPMTPNEKKAYTGYKVINGSKVFVCYLPKSLGITDITKANNWLKSNNVTIQYILANEVFEPFENQELFDNIVTYDNTTYLTATDNADMWVEYYSNSSIGQRLAKTDEEMRAEHRRLQEQIATEHNALQEQITEIKNTVNNQTITTLYEGTNIVVRKSGNVIEVVGNGASFSDVDSCISNIHWYIPKSKIITVCWYKYNDGELKTGIFILGYPNTIIEELSTGDYIYDNYIVSFRAMWLIDSTV